MTELFQPIKEAFIDCYTAIAESIWNVVPAIMITLIIVAGVILIAKQIKKIKNR